MIYDRSESFKPFHGGMTARCFESHPPLPLKDGLVIYGGSCSSPIVRDADIYVGLDHSHARSPKAYPWEVGESFLFHITDMHAPNDPAQFFKLIDWLVVQLIAQKKVHIGCIGGHGRTGTVLSALVSVMMDEKNAIGYVRKHYCQKAVESAAQIEFLSKHFGVTREAPAKTFRSKDTRTALLDFPVERLPTSRLEVLPIRSGVSMWGPSFTLTIQKNVV